MLLTLLLLFSGQITSAEVTFAQNTWQFASPSPVTFEFILNGKTYVREITSIDFGQGHKIRGHFLSDPAQTFGAVNSGKEYFVMNFLTRQAGPREAKEWTSVLKLILWERIQSEGRVVLRLQQGRWTTGYPQGFPGAGGFVSTNTTNVHFGPGLRLSQAIETMRVVLQTHIINPDSWTFMYELPSLMSLAKRLADNNYAGVVPAEVWSSDFHTCGIDLDGPEFKKEQ